MSNDVCHFAIHADDCVRAKRFYTDVFGWSFQPWGPPGFWLIHTSPSGVRGALQKRRELVEGRGMIGFECTIGVEDVEAIGQAIKAHGGKVTMPPMLLETVGTLLMFEDTEGNQVGAMQYLEEVKG
jgi:predicted enzyme related to lactoylglutathione lyase